jgi:hypothetical protein
LPKAERYVQQYVDFNRLSQAITGFCMQNQMETQVFPDQSVPPAYFQIQAKKAGAGRRIVGAARCMDIVVRGRPDDFEVQVAAGDWGKNLAPAVIVGIATLGIGLIWGGASAATYKAFEGKVWEFIRAQVYALRNTAPPNPPR